MNSPSRRLWALLLVISCQSSLQASSPADPFYVAGVVEFRSTNAALRPLTENLNAYLEMIASKEAAATDIIIFPESTLNSYLQTTYVPDPNDEVVPCDQASEHFYFLKQLSCQAKAHAKYVVVNVVEKEKCPSSPADTRPCGLTGLNIFNTNVVFDRQGMVVARYRKVNLYGEPKNTTYLPEYGIFDTDFGVRFGHFICFDILFYTPAQEIVERYGVTDFIFPTMWFSQLPFLTAVQIQQAWAYANDVNFLAAGASNPSVGSTGTGIYAGRQGPLLALMTHGTGERSIHVAQVPKRAPARHFSRKQLASVSVGAPPTAVAGSSVHLTQSDIFLKRDYLELYESEPLELGLVSGQIEHELCFETFCCHLRMRYRWLNTTLGSRFYSYRLGAYAGWRKEAAAQTNQVRNCALFTCIGDSIDDCGKLLPAGEAPIEPQHMFEEIELSAKYPVGKQMLLMPSTLKDDLMPLAVQQFLFEVDTSHRYVHAVSFSLQEPVGNLLAFAIYGNYFDGDLLIDDDNGNGNGDENGNGGQSSLRSAFVLLLLSLGIGLLGAV